MITASDFAIMAISILMVLYLLGKSQMGYFINTGISYIEPLPFIGNVFRVFTGKEHLNDAVNRSYRSFEGEKYVGFYNFSQAIVIIKDLDLLKQITVKDFDHFVDHLVIVSPEVDPLFFNNLFNLKGDRWRDMRNTLSPAFTASKMKEMIPFIEKCTERLIIYLKKENIDHPTKEGYKEIELKHFLTRFTNDVIASCAFGIESDSLNDNDNTFFKMSEELTQFSGGAVAKFAGFFLCPAIMKYFKISLMGETMTNFFRSTVTGIIESREKSGVVRRDMIHLLMQAVKGSLHEETTKINENTGLPTINENNPEKRTEKRNWTEDEIVAQVVIFLFAGFDTVSTMLSFMMYELCVNRDVHDRLQAEIDDYIRDNNGAMATYNDLHKLKYLDMVCSETLRLWPPVGIVDRQCVKPYRLPPSNPDHAGHTLQKGDLIHVAIFPIHRDPTHWPNPEKFDPERFSDDNKGSIHPFSYLPFGAGPRSCIGNRFAMMEIKLLAFHLLYNFDLVMTPRTESPIKLMNHFFTLTAKNGFWVGIKPRDITKL